MMIDFDEPSPVIAPSHSSGLPRSHRNHDSERYNHLVLRFVEAELAHSVDRRILIIQEELGRREEPELTESINRQVVSIQEDMRTQLLDIVRRGQSRAEEDLQANRALAGECRSLNQPPFPHETPYSRLDPTASVGYSPEASMSPQLIENANETREQTTGENGSCSVPVEDPGDRVPTQTDSGYGSIGETCSCHCHVNFGTERSFYGKGIRGSLRYHRTALKGH